MPPARVSLPIHATTDSRSDHRIGSDPEEHDGTAVAVTAWGVLEFEGAALFLSRSEWPFLLSENGIWLEAPEDAFAHIEFPFEGMLYVEGTFFAGDPVRGFRGRIEVTRILKAEPPHPRLRPPDAPE